MSIFLRKFVCTPMDKAADTSVFQCTKVYITDIINDPGDGGTYEDVDGHSGAWKQSSEAFIAKFGLELSPFADTSLEGISVHLHLQSLQQQKEGQAVLLRKQASLTTVLLFSSQASMLVKGNLLESAIELTGWPILLP